VIFATVGLSLLLADGLFVTWGATRVYDAPNWDMRIKRGGYLFLAAWAFFIPAIACIFAALNRGPGMRRTGSAAEEDHERSLSVDNAETRSGDAPNQPSGEPDRMPKPTAVAAAGKVVPQSDRFVAKRRAQNREPEEFAPLPWHGLSPSIVWPLSGIFAGATVGALSWVLLAAWASLNGWYEDIAGQFIAFSCCGAILGSLLWYPIQLIWRGW
jgi:hypothetical protein